MSAGVARIFSYITTVAVARALGVAAFGRFSFIFAIFYAYSIVTNVGLENLIVRRVARRSTQAVPDIGAGIGPDIGRFLGDAAVLRLVALPFGLAAALLLWLRDPSSLGSIAFLFIYGLANGYILYANAIVRGLEKMELQTLLMSLQAILTLGFVIAALRWQTDPTLVAQMYALGSVGIALLGAWLVRHNGVRPTPRIDLDRWRALWQLNWPFLLTLLGLLILDRMVVVLLAIFTSDEALGWFNAVYFIILATLNVPQIVINALLPALSRDAQAGSQNAVRRTVWLASGIVIALGIGVGGGLFFISDWLIPFAYGSDFTPAAEILRILAVSLPFLFLMVVLNGALQGIDAQRRAARSFWLALLLSLPLSVILTAAGGYRWGTISYTLMSVIVAASLTFTTVRVLQQSAESAPLPQS